MGLIVCWFDGVVLGFGLEGPQHVRGAGLLGSITFQKVHTTRSFV